MATKRQQERKKKAREQKARARVNARRHKLDLAKKHERKNAELDRRFREKIKPIVNDPEAKKKLEEAENRKIIEKLERNAQILKALEDEYTRDKEQKQALNEHLEAEGHHTLKEKISAMEEKARASMDQNEAESGQIDLT